jgi:hypothetical protein
MTQIKGYIFSESYFLTLIFFWSLLWDSWSDGPLWPAGASWGLLEPPAVSWSPLGVSYGLASWSLLELPGGAS